MRKVLKLTCWRYWRVSAFIDTNLASMWLFAIQDRWWSNIFQQPEICARSDRLRGWYCCYWWGLFLWDLCVVAVPFWCIFLGFLGLWFRSLYSLQYQSLHGLIISLGTKTWTAIGWFPPGITLKISYNYSFHLLLDLGCLVFNCFFHNHLIQNRRLNFHGCSCWARPSISCS